MKLELSADARRSHSEILESSAEATLFMSLEVVHRNHDVRISYGRTDLRRRAIASATTEEAIMAVVEDKADCMVASKLVVAFSPAHGFSDIVRLAGDNVLLEDKIAIAVHKENTVLLEKLNAELENNLQTPKYKQIYRTYFGSIK